MDIVLFEGCLNFMISWILYLHNTNVSKRFLMMNSSYVIIILIKLTSKEPFYGWLLDISINSCYVMDCLARI